MGFAKRSLERTYVRLSDRSEGLFTCEVEGCSCGGEEAFAIQTDGNEMQTPVCKFQVDNNAALCGVCEDQVAYGDFVIGTDGSPVQACRSCEAAFYG